MRIYPINFIFVLISTGFASADYACPVERCGMSGPDIHFPFRLKGRQQKTCGYPGFDLSCSQSNETLLELPHSVNFIVKRIDYPYQSITLLNVNGCLSASHPELNLSATPFQSADLKGLEDSPGYTLFNCSSGEIIDYSLRAIPCPSSRNSNYVYAVDSHVSLYRSEIYIFGLLFSCRKMFKLSSFPSHTFTLYWYQPDCKPCEMLGKYCRLKHQGSALQTECYPLAPDTTTVEGEHNYLSQQKEDRGSLVKKIIKGVVIGLSLLGVVIFTVRFSIKKKKEDQRRLDQFLKDYVALRPTRYTYADIKKITNQFSEKLGRGGYGTVYKGKLSNDVLVAVKVLDNSNGNGEEFINEVATMGRIHHVNVVRLVGYYADGYRRGLVYEFLPNDSLEKVISGTQGCSLGWEKLQQIAIGIAKGLDYLHQGCNQRILHFDIKPQNILLDHNFNPKVADFGLAKLCSKEQSIVSMSAARGTIGYIAPEVFSRNYGNVSYRADIYSFGMLLLDMVGGRKNFRDAEKDNSQLYFPEWMYNQLEKGEEVAIKIDKEEDDEIFKKLSIVGLWCIQWYPANRPSMKLVIQMLEGEAIPLMPPNPFASMESSSSSSANAKALRIKFQNQLESISEGD